MTAQANAHSSQPDVYQGQFGDFTITDADRQGVLIYRTALLVAALCFAVGATLVLWQGTAWLFAVSLLYTGFVLALGVSLLTIHIYMAALHRVLQVFWGIGAIAAVIIAHADPEPFALTVYHHPLSIVGIGFTFAALTGIFFKEAFCFDRLETKFLTPLVPVLLLGHLTGILPVMAERVLLAVWAVLFMIFALRKTVQAIPADIGDKSVFAYLKQRSNQPHPQS